MPKMPWDYHADLASDRLQLVAKLLRDTRRDVLVLHDPGAGDTAWSLGSHLGQDFPQCMYTPVQGAGLDI
jgi:hypothetical protein